MLMARKNFGSSSKSVSFNCKFELFKRFTSMPVFSYMVNANAVGWTPAV